jgi:RNA polymerase nonessential primary-like sigma factor
MTVPQTVPGPRTAPDHVSPEAVETTPATDTTATADASDAAVELSAEDLDAQSPAADLVRFYLNGIGKTALLTAAQEVDLAKRIEAGVFAKHVLDSAAADAVEIDPAHAKDLRLVVRDGERARNHLLEANLRLVVSLAKRYTGRGMPLLDLI